MRQAPALTVSDMRMAPSYGQEKNGLDAEDNSLSNLGVVRNRLTHLVGSKP